MQTKIQAFKRSMKIEDHYCSAKCKEDMKLCDLCLAQRRKRQQDKNVAESKPTLMHKPFAEFVFPIKKT